MNGGLIDYQAAVVGFAVAFLLAVLLTPVVSQAAWQAGVVDVSSDERRLHDRPKPLLGGLAILGAIAIPAIALGHHHGFWGIVAGATLMSLLGAFDDIRPLHPGVKMAGIVAIAAIPASLDVTIDHVTLPILGVFDLGLWQYPVTILWIVAIANIVNFIDGMDGLAAGFCAIAALTFSILSASLSHPEPAAVCAIVAGAAIGFLRYNFHPATIIMGDSGSLTLGYLLATLAIQGVLKTAAAVSLVFPLVILALPILDTSFVILKRLKYRQPIYRADRSHFHHRFANIGFSQRRTALIMYGWCLVLSAFALAIRFVPNHRHGWDPVAVVVLGGLGVVALGTSVYVIYLLEILKLRHLQALGLFRSVSPEMTQRRPAA
jgi:UDP-GlcNAc:undecaprenyl-phosphate/decaprenyl-phosphate GlcNAc-1-phosphate transferase